MPAVPVLLLLAALAIQTASAQGVPSLTAHPAESVSVDGLLDEADWADAEIATDFVQFEPDEGAPSAQATRVRVLFSSDALYVGAEMLDTEPGRIRQTLSRRDDTGGADAFVVALDSYNDERTARLFGVTAAGVQFDAILEGDNDDDSWDAVWASAVRVTPEGWTAEFRIPFSQLRFTGGQPSWGLNFQREIPRLGEESYWAPFGREQTNAGIVQFFGRLNGVESVRPRRLVQAVPYSLASGSRSEDEDVPGTAAYGDEVDAGADFKIGLSPSVILDATINPDFGQVDADPAELNLGTFETFFSERRPFFLEGTQIFDDGFSRDGALLYTRRIGGDAPIIAATKLTGRTASGLSFGALAAATGADFDPSQLYGVARVRQELSSQNYVGGTLTAFDGTLSALCDRRCARSTVAAADWQYRLGANEAYQAEGVLAGSLREGAGETERGFALYTGLDQVRGFRRFGSGLRIYSPGFRNNDVGNFRQTDLIEVNGAIINQWNRNEPFGPLRRLNSFVFSSAGWTYSNGTFRGADFGISADGQLRGFQDVGFSVNVDGIGGDDVRETRGLGPIQNILNGSIGLDLSTDTRRQFVGEVELGIAADADGGFGFGPELSIEWAASDRLQLQVGAEAEFARGFRAWAANEGLVRDADGRLFIGAEAGAPGGLAADGLVDLGLSTGEIETLLAGVTPDPNPVALPGGTGYFLPLFGARDFNAADVTARANIIFRPNLSLQLYGQLFAARGQYRDFRVLAARDDLREFDAYPKRRDFSFAEFRTNTVLRWEYRPGSAVFVVWQHATGDDRFEEVFHSDAGVSPYDRSTFGQISDLFQTFADDVVLVKVSYLLAR